MDGLNERRDQMKKDRLKGCVMERRRGYITTEGLCVNVVSTLEAICCDNNKILTLQGRKCSVSGTIDWGYRARNTERHFHNYRKRNVVRTTSSPSFYWPRLSAKIVKKIPTHLHTVQSRRGHSALIHHWASGAGRLHKWRPISYY